MNTIPNPFTETPSGSRLALVDQALARIHDGSGEGAKTFTRVYDDAARATADFADRMAQLAVEAAPLAGLPISIKDLFDIKNEVTMAGSRALASAAPALADAEIVRRLRHAGAPRLTAKPT